VRGIRERLTYANVMVTILAVLVIGGGGAYAAKKIKLKNNSVTTAKIRNGAVTDPKLAASVGDRSIGRTVAETTGVCSVTPGGDVCSFVTLQLPRPARVLVIADATALSTGTALNGVTGVLPPGQHTFSLFCSQAAGAFQVAERHISAVSLSAD
jgi:hypothetical protein